MHRITKHLRLWRIAAVVAIWCGAPCDASMPPAASEGQPNVVIILADDKYSHWMRERYFIHANQGLSWRMTDFRTTPNYGQFIPIP
jgi:hypothetical protein